MKVGVQRGQDLVVHGLVRGENWYDLMVLRVVNE